MPPDLLFHTPALASLDLSGSRLGLPTDFLAYAPELRQLTLRDVDPECLSFLPPGLEDLDLEVPAGRTELPADLFHAPQLRSLTLRAAGLTRLPGDWLAHVSALEYLTLDTPRLTALPVDFQTGTPNLREVRDHRGCAVSVMDPVDRPHLLAPLPGCLREPVMRRRGGDPRPPSGTAGASGRVGNAEAPSTGWGCCDGDSQFRPSSSSPPLW